MAWGPIYRTKPLSRPRASRYEYNNEYNNEYANNTLETGAIVPIAELEKNSFAVPVLSDPSNLAVGETDPPDVI